MTDVEIRTGSEWSNGMRSAGIDLEGVVIEYHPDLKEILIGPGIINIPEEIISLELMLMYTYHMINKFNEETFRKHKIVYIRDIIANHILGEKLLNAILEISTW